MPWVVDADECFVPLAWTADGEVDVEKTMGTLLAAEGMGRGLAGDVDPNDVRSITHRAPRLVIKAPLTEAEMTIIHAEALRVNAEIDLEEARRVQRMLAKARERQRIQEEEIRERMRVNSERVDAMRTKKKETAEAIYYSTDLDEWLRLVEPFVPAMTCMRALDFTSVMQAFLPHCVHENKGSNFATRRGRYFGSLLGRLYSLGRLRFLGGVDPIKGDGSPFPCSIQAPAGLRDSAVDAESSSA